jgi:hypothetical protein
MFFPYQEAIFWDESRASQESDGPMVSWAKMMPIIIVVSGFMTLKTI